MLLNGEKMADRIVEERKKLIDCHSHTHGISRCCKAYAPEVIAAAKEKGIDGLVLTNHYHKPYITRDGKFANARELASAYLDEYYYAQYCAKQEGLELFFGIEVTMERHDMAHLLVYGVDESFVTDNEEMFEYTQKELYELVHKAGGALVQAHPLRKGKNALLDLGYLDGLELSSHIRYDGSHFEELSAIAHEHGLILTSGGDYHKDTDRSFCGMYLPCSIKDTKDFARYLLTTDTVDLLVQEAAGEESHRELFTRKRRDREQG